MRTLADLQAHAETAGWTVAGVNTHDTVDVTFLILHYLPAMLSIHAWFYGDHLYEARIYRNAEFTPAETTSSARTVDHWITTARDAEVAA